MAENTAEGLENLVDHVEFEDLNDQHEVPHRSTREKHSTEWWSLRQKVLGKDKSIPFIYSGDSK